MLSYEIDGCNSISGARTGARRFSALLVIALAAWSSVVQAADPMAGKKIYVQHCQNCHGERGVPQWPGVPDFSHGERLLQPDTVLLATIRSGKDMMPSYRGALQDDEILDVIAYLRTLR